MSIESVILFNHFIFCLKENSCPQIFPNIRVFSNMGSNLEGHTCIDSNYICPVFLLHWFSFGIVNKKVHLIIPLHFPTLDWKKLTTWIRIRLPRWLSEESACTAGDLSWIFGLGRSPGEGNGTQPSILAWRIPWTEEPGGLWSKGLQIIRYKDKY